MIIRESEGLRYFQFESLAAEKVTQAIFTRLGGISPRPWDSLNLGSTVGDDLDRVAGNKHKVLESIGFSESRLAQIHQVHSARVIKIEGPAVDKSRLIPGDAMITDIRDLLMLMRFADCVPIYIYDPVNHAAALAHAGWKGTVQGIARETVRALEKEYGSNPKDLLAGIGPSIGPDHYQIGDDVIQEVKNAYGDTWSQVLKFDHDGVKLNLWRANEIALEYAGVKNIEIAGICTACETGDWFSHRAEKGKTGRFAAVFALA
ncbi:MAG: peptidoglycan editing factor PgeF [Anaerolineales bacterium]|nr:peptidoglycan editing factor PgeF [Anaerolineales bacterium]